MPNPTKTLKGNTPASNNVSSQIEVQNFDEPKLSETNPALFMQKYNMNEIKLAGKVVDKEISDPKPKIDKKTNEHIIDATGTSEFWDPFYSVEIIFEGASMRLNLKKELYEKLTIGKRYQFEGMMGMEFKKTQPIFFLATLIA